MYPSLALAAVAAHLRVPLPEMHMNEDRELTFRDRHRLLDRDGSFRMLPNQGTYPTYSAVDVVTSLSDEDTQRGQPAIPRSAFDDKIVLIGATAAGLHDQQITPMGSATAGTLVHAFAIDNLLSGAVATTAAALGWLAVDRDHGPLSGCTMVQPARGDSFP